MRFAINHIWNWPLRFCSIFRVLWLSLSKARHEMFPKVFPWIACMLISIKIFCYRIYLRMNDRKNTKSSSQFGLKQAEDTVRVVPEVTSTLLTSKLWPCSVWFIHTSYSFVRQYEYVEVNLAQDSGQHSNEIWRMDFFTEYVGASKKLKFSDYKLFLKKSNEISKTAFEVLCNKNTAAKCLHCAWRNPRILQS